MFRKLESVKAAKTVGPDGMQPRFLKGGVNEMEEPLTDIFRKCVRTGELLMDRREANVTPYQTFNLKSSKDIGTVTDFHVLRCCASINVAMAT